MPLSNPNKFREAVEVLQRGREALVDVMADEIISQGADLIDGGYLFNEFLESQGTRLHFLGLLIGQLEQSADALDESTIAAETAVATPSPARKRSRARPRKIGEKLRSEGSSEDL